MRLTSALFARQARVLAWIEKNTKHTHICEYLQATYHGDGPRLALAVAMERILAGVQGHVGDAEGQSLSVEATCCRLWSVGFGAFWAGLAWCGFVWRGVAR